MGDIDMEHLAQKPFYLTDEDILWVGSTLADMTEDDIVSLLLFTPEFKWPFKWIGRTSDQKVKPLQSSGYAACVTNFPGDEVDERESHLIVHMNTLSFEKWDMTFGAGYRACIDAGVMAVMVSPILFPAFLEKLYPDITEADMLPATLSNDVTTLLLKERFFFNGVVIADNVANINIPLAIAAGCDMIKVTGGTENAKNRVKKGIADGTITPERLRDALVQVLGMKAALGLHK
jgi:beta-N-acetylhexosaminidase